MASRARAAKFSAAALWTLTALGGSCAARVDSTRAFQNGVIELVPVQHRDVARGFKHDCSCVFRDAR